MDSDNKTLKFYTRTLISVAALITFLFIAYSSFNKPVDELGVGGSNDKSVFERIVDRFKGKDDLEGVIDDLAASDIREGFEEVAGASTIVTTTNDSWIATDYVQGDIKSGTYTVKTGDTLWEIAEAVYGDGTQWHKILEANNNSIGYLPNGSQALIVAGQTLNIL